jgi:anti-sigma-K factor RskA
MTRDDCRSWREEIGAYLLGGLPDDRRTALLAHLDGCNECRAEVEELAEVARSMRAADPLRNHDRPLPPPNLIESIVGAIADERRGRRMRLRRRAASALAAAAVLIGAGVFAITTLRDEPPGMTVAFADAPAGVSASADLEYQPGGIRIELQVAGLPEKQTFGVWLESEDGDRVPAGTFYTSEGEDKFSVPFNAAMSLDDCAGIGVSNLEQDYTVLQADLEWSE